MRSSFLLAWACVREHNPLALGGQLQGSTLYPLEKGS